MTINNVITFNTDSHSYIFLIDKLINYAFKYITSGSKDGFIEYKLNSGQGFELDKKKMENNNFWFKFIRLY